MKIAAMLACPAKAFLRLHVRFTIFYQSCGGAENLRRESYRLSSFQRFPASVPIDARQFAAAGFYYTGQFDEVKCFACSNRLRTLSPRTDPFLLSMHRFAFCLIPQFQLRLNDPCWCSRKSICICKALTYVHLNQTLEKPHI